MKNSYLESLFKEFNYYKFLGENTFNQLSDSELQWAPNQDSNSIAIIVKHLSGNMLSRWTNVFLEDGEKSWRLRDQEFISETSNKETILGQWDTGLNLKEPLAPRFLFSE